MADIPEAGLDGFVSVAKASQVSEGSMISVTVSGKPILIARSGGKFFAMEAVCSYVYGYLPRGELRGSAVVCPVHKAQYDIATGKVVKNVPVLMRLASRREATDLHTYEVKVLGDSLLIRV